MKNSIKFLILAFSIIPLIASSQGGKICNWKDDKKGAVVLSFDDWSPGHYPIVVPELDSRNLHATFFLTLSSVAAWNHNWPTVVSTASNGHEMGNHTATHPSLTGQTSAQLHTEITTARNTINNNVPSQKVVSFAYPLGAGAGNSAKDIEIQDTLMASGHIGARSVNAPAGQYSYNFATSLRDYYKIRTYAMSGTVSTNTFATETQNVIAGGGLMVYLYHSVDDLANSHGDTWYSKVLQDSLQKQLDTIVSLQDKIWVATFGEAIRYHRERKCATLAETLAPNGSLWKLSLTDTIINNSVFNQALTLKLKMNSIAYDNIYQNGLSITYTIIGDTIQFDAVPDGGEIVLSVGALPTNELPTLSTLSNMTINQDAGVQTINLSGISAGISETQNISITAVAYNSTLIQNLIVNYNSPNTTGTITFTPNPLASGNTTIVVRVTDDGTPARYIEKSFTISVAPVITSNQMSANTLNNAIVLSPNPSNGNVSITSDKMIGAVSISIEEVSGTTIFEEDFLSDEKIILNLSSYKSGVYLVRVKTNLGMVVKKLVVL